MCGIAGALFADRARPCSKDGLRRMADAISHRGPDAEGLWTDAGVGLAHRRLSIIDLSGGNQPIGNEDNSVQVVFNGEIYNYRELKADLEKRGHQFRTNSDTEVLVHLYEEYGEELVQRLRGMFAFALWDLRREELLLARDRIGLKPLYYYHDARQLLFASEIKPILTCPNIDRSIDHAALEDYLALGVIPGERSIFQHIRKLQAGHVLKIRRTDFQVTPKRYWKLNVEVDNTLTEQDWQEAVRAKFHETVKAHEIADVPVGAFLSGGLDSSAICASMVENGTGSVQTFSIGFQEERFSELPYARALATQFGTQHVEEIVTPQAVESLEDLVTYYDEPFADASAIPTMCVSKLARQHVKVVLSGDGGDEAFGGYARYAHDLQEAAFRQRIPKLLRKSVIGPMAQVWPKADWLPRYLRAKTALTNLSLDAAAAYANTLSICRQPLRRELLNADLRSQLNGHQPESRTIAGFGDHETDPLRGMIAADVDLLLPDDFLTKVDRASMAVGLEVRPPMVDHEFLELTARMPSQYKVRAGETKWLFKKMCDGWLPNDVVRRRKQGFEIPIDDWLRGPLRDSFEAAVLSPQSCVGEMIDQTRARRLYEKHQRRTGQYGNILWSLLVLGCWSERYLGQAATTSSHEAV